jgi:hypothetical protein
VLQHDGESRLDRGQGVSVRRAAVEYRPMTEQELQSMVTVPDSGLDAQALVDGAGYCPT